MLLVGDTEGGLTLALVARGLGLVERLGRAVERHEERRVVLCDETERGEQGGLVLLLGETALELNPFDTFLLELVEAIKAGVEGLVLVPVREELAICVYSQFPVRRLELQIILTS